MAGRPGPRSPEPSRAPGSGERQLLVGQAHISCRVDTAAAMMASVREGIGIAFLPQAIAGSDPGLRQLTDPIPELAGTVWILAHRDLRSTVRVRAYTDHMHAAVRGESAALPSR